MNKKLTWCETPQNISTLQIEEVETNNVRPSSPNRDILGGTRPENKLRFIVVMISLPTNVTFQYSCKIVSKATGLHFSVAWEENLEVIEISFI